MVVDLLREDVQTSGLLDLFKELVEDSYTEFKHVRRWKEETGGHALGYFPVYFPEELAHAVGLLPVRLLGASGRVSLDIATAYTQSFVCSIGRSVFQLACQGLLDAFDALIFSNICDVARNLSGIMKRNLKSKPIHIDYIHYPINNTSQYAAEYLKGEYLRILRELERLTGTHLREDELRRSIELHNQKRRLQRRLAELKNEKPWLVPYTEYYTAMRAGAIMPVELYVQTLANYLEEVNTRRVRPKDKIRVVVMGNFCEQPPLMLMRTIEEAGCYIIHDEALLGSYWLESVHVDDGDPILSLAKGYIENPAPLTVRFHPSVNKHEYVLRMLKDVRAEGIIFCTPKFCEPALYDYVIFKLALEKAKIPYMHIEYEESSSSFEHVRTMVETFAESILFD